MPFLPFSQDRRNVLDGADIRGVSGFFLLTEGDTSLKPISPFL